MERQSAIVYIEMTRVAISILPTRLLVACLAYIALILNSISLPETRVRQ